MRLPFCHPLKFLLIFSIVLPAYAQPLHLSNGLGSDPAAKVIGQLKGTMIYATNSTNEKNSTAKKLDGELRKVINKHEKLDFKEYLKLGTDTQSVFRSYENWLKPIKGSDQVMLSFEPKAETKDGYKFDINFWQNKRKVFTTQANLTPDTPLLITGPDWRGGKIVFALELSP